MSYPLGTGRVVLVGAGPGDPDLLTLRAVRCLQQADVVVYDRLVDERVLEHGPARRICVGKQRGWHSWPQEDINGLLIDLARQGLQVVRLKGGDPYVFGRGGEELDAVQAAGIPCEVVPGVSSAVAGPASAGIPVTHRGVSSMVTIVSGHADPGHPDSTIDWARLAGLNGTLVILMGMASLDAITRTLAQHGMAADTPAAVVQQATTAHQRVVTGTLADLGQLASAARLEAPAIIVIGAVAARARRALLPVLAETLNLPQRLTS